MEITEVRIKLMDEGGERLQAFCSITFDDSFVIRDLKIIEGTNGPFVAMPSRKLTAHCPQCGSKNHLRTAYCNHCGGRLKEDRFLKDEDGRAKLYADIAHPINSSCREMIQERVIREFQKEIERAKLPGYVSRYDDFDPEDAVCATALGRRSGAGRTPGGNAETHPGGRTSAASAPCADRPEPAQSPLQPGAGRFWRRHPLNRLRTGKTLAFLRERPARSARPLRIPGARPSRSCPGPAWYDMRLPAGHARRPIHQAYAPNRARYGRQPTFRGHWWRRYRPVGGTAAARACPGGPNLAARSRRSAGRSLADRPAGRVLDRARRRQFHHQLPERAGAVSRCRPGRQRPARHKRATAAGLRGPSGPAAPHSGRIPADGAGANLAPVGERAAQPLG